MSEKIDLLTAYLSRINPTQISKNLLRLRDKFAKFYPDLNVTDVFDKYVAYPCAFIMTMAEQAMADIARTMATGAIDHLPDEVKDYLCDIYQIEQPGVQEQEFTVLIMAGPVQQPIQPDHTFRLTSNNTVLRPAGNPEVYVTNYSAAAHTVLRIPVRIEKYENPIPAGTELSPSQAFYGVTAFLAAEDIIISPLDLNRHSRLQLQLNLERKRDLQSIIQEVLRTLIPGQSLRFSLQPREKELEIFVHCPLRRKLILTNFQNGKAVIDDPWVISPAYDLMQGMRLSYQVTKTEDGWSVTSSVIADGKALVPFYVFPFAKQLTAAAEILQQSLAPLGIESIQFRPCQPVFIRLEVSIINRQLSRTCQEFFDQIPINGALNIPMLLHALGSKVTGLDISRCRVQYSTDGHDWAQIDRLNLDLPLEPETKAAFVCMDPVVLL